MSKECTPSKCIAAVNGWPVCGRGMMQHMMCLQSSWQVAPHKPCQRGPSTAQGDFVVLKVLGVADISSLTDVTAMTDGLSIVPAVQLANGITQAMPDGAIHTQGNFVVLKLLEVAEPIDCMSLAGALLPSALRITGEKNKTFHGLEIMLKLVFKIVSTANSPLRDSPICHLCWAAMSQENLGALCTCLASSCMSCQQLSRMHKLARALFRMLPSSCRCVRTCIEA